MFFENVVQLVASSYLYLVTQLVTGPLSLSWLGAFVLLPIALMIPPDKLSHSQLVYFFLIPIFALTIHSWLVIGWVDVVGVDMLCWSIYLLYVVDPRVKFTRIKYITPAEMAQVPSTNTSANGKVQEIFVKNDTSHAHVNGNGQVPLQEKAVPNGNMTGRGKILDPANYMDVAQISQLRSEAVMTDETYPIELGPRLLWVFNLVCSDRMVRWRIGSPGHDSHQKRLGPTRRQYASSLLPVLLFATFCFCVTNLLATHDPYFRSAALVPLASPYNIASTKTPYTVLFLQYLLPPSILRPLALGFFAWSLLTFEFNLVPLIVVGINYLTGSRFPRDNWSPHTLPAYFGPFTSVLDGGLRRAWGTWWHQHMRFMVTAPGIALVKFFRIPQKSAVSLVIPQISAFLFSGIAHMGLVPPNLPFAKGEYSAMSLRLMTGAIFLGAIHWLLCRSSG